MIGGEQAERACSGSAGEASLIQAQLEDKRPYLLREPRVLGRFDVHGLGAALLGAAGSLEALAYEAAPPLDRRDRVDDAPAERTGSSQPAVVALAEKLVLSGPARCDQPQM